MYVAQVPLAKKLNARISFGADPPQFLGCGSKNSNFGKLFDIFSIGDLLFHNGKEYGKSEISSLIIDYQTILTPNLVEVD